ncbi:MAG: hypothetical protein HY000_37110 [Planctomycetes bacterium]|nr:hypothetical protein [Planctomycetota bacterium]
MATDVQRLIEQIQALPLEDRTRIREALETNAAPERSAAELQARLIAVGLLKEFKQPRRDVEGFHTR